MMTLDLLNLTNPAIQGRSVRPALIMYDMRHFAVSADGTNLVKNTGDGGDQYNGIMYGSSWVYLNGIDQSVALPIVHELGADTKQPATLGDGWTDNGGNSYTASNATSALSALSSAPAGNVQINFTISNWTAGTVEGYGANGTYTVDVTDDSLDADNFSGDVLINSVQEITIPSNSYVTYNDYGTKSHKTLDHTQLPISTKYNLTESFQSYFATDVPVTDADRAILDTDPGAVYRLYLADDTATGLSFSKANVIYFCPGTEGELGGADVYDIAIPSTYEIVNYTTACRTALQNQNVGASNLLLKQDATTGRPTGLADANTIQFTSDDRYVDTQWTPNGTYTIQETVTLEDGTTEDRVYAVDASQTTSVEMILTSTTEPTFDHDGTLTVTDNGDGTWHVISDDATYCRTANTTDNKNNITGINLICTDGLINSFNGMLTYSSPVEVMFGDIYSGEQTDMGRMMSNWSSITTPPDLSSFDTSKVTSMYSMMYNWSSVTTPPDLSSFDTSNVIRMDHMMSNWSSITTPPDLSSFDTSKVTSMYSMMYNWSSITTPPDLSSFDTSKVTNMYSMMSNWSSITTPPDLGSFNTSKVTNMGRMMSNWGSITTPPDLSSFDTSRVTDMDYMMYKWSSIAEIGDIGVENFNVTSLTSAKNFAAGSKFATSTYDKILVNWEAQITAQQVTDGLDEINFGDSQYTAGSDAETARTNLINLGINIIDGGAAE